MNGFWFRNLIIFYGVLQVLQATKLVFLIMRSSLCVFVFFVPFIFFQPTSHVESSGPLLTNLCWGRIFLWQLAARRIEKVDMMIFPWLMMVNDG